MRGEKSYTMSMANQWLGSPPHARGKVARALVYKGRVGITPACAGKRLKKIP